MPIARCAVMGLAAWLSLVGHAATRPLTPPKGAELLQRAHATPTPTPAKSRSGPDAMPNTASPAPIHIRVGPRFGWEHCLTISNGQAEVFIAPAVGRVMAFHFAGEPSPFWQDPTLHGRHPDPASSEWGNFGGDKTWPAPQADWPRITPRAWPPPATFDAMPSEAFVRRDTVVLASPVDPHYGIRTERIIHLEPKAPVMTIVTTYHKVDGPPVRVGVWIISQLEDPLGVYLPVPPNTLFPEGYNRQSGDSLPAELRFERGLLSMTRDPKTAAKIGSDADRMLWIGRDHTLLIESPRMPGEEYPDQQSSAEIYTNPDPKAYVELETLGPLRTLRVGDTLSQTNTYTLGRRVLSDPEAEARRILRR